MNYRKILFLYFTVFNLVAKDFKRLGVFSGDYYSARVAVNAVCKGGAEAVFLLGVVLAFIVQIMLYSCDKSVVVFVFIGVNKKSLLFIG